MINLQKPTDNLRMMSEATSSFTVYDAKGGDWQLNRYSTCWFIHHNGHVEGMNLIPGETRIETLLRAIRAVNSTYICEALDRARNQIRGRKVDE